MSFLPRALIRSVAATGSGITPAVVATTSSNPANGTNRTVTIPAPASGNTLLVIAKAASGIITALTDNQTNTYTRDYLEALDSERQIWRCHNITNGPVTLQFTNTSDVIYVRVLEVSGLANAGPVVAGGQTFDSASATSLSRVHTTVAPNELIVGYLWTPNTFTVVSSVLPSGLVNVPAVGASERLHAFYFMQASASATTLNETVSVAHTNRSLGSISYAHA